MRAVQYFSDEALERGRALTTDQILVFIENFRTLHSSSSGKTKAISIKIPEDLLTAFRLHAELKGKKYQTLIKELMIASLDEPI